MTTATGRIWNQPGGRPGDPGQNGDDRAWDALVKRYAPSSGPSAADTSWTALTPRMSANTSG